MEEKRKGVHKTPNDSTKNQEQYNQNTSKINIKSLESDYTELTRPLKNSSIEDLLKNAEINIYEEIKLPPTLLSIDNISAFTLGNFSCIIGKSKSRKTFFLSMLIAAVLDEKGLSQRIKSALSRPTVIHFDTEQSKYHTQVVAKRIMRLTNSFKNIDNYKCYCLRPFNTETRIKIIEESIYNTDELKLVVIDGIADLIKGYNNEEDAIRVVQKLLTWSETLNVHIITVLHQNKGDNNAKGHLGSMITQKAETLLSVEKDGETSTAKSVYSRDREINPISFRIDEEGIPYFTDYIANNSGGTNRKSKKPFDYKKEVHLNILNDVFKDEESLSSQDLKLNIKYVLASYDIEIGDNAVRMWKKHYEKQNMIYRENQQSPYKLVS